MITNASPWDNIKFDIDGIEEVRRKFFGTLYNTYSFFALYANVDGFDYSDPDVEWSKRPEIDRWILSLLNSLVKDVDGYLEAYEPTRAGRAISDFVNDNLSNWYVRLNRRRFWGGGMTEDKLSAYQTLYTCLETVAKLMAPIAPFYADQLFLDLVAVTGRENVESVHLSDFPVYDESKIDKNLEERMQMAQDVSSMVLALRRKVNIKVRQPLHTVMIPVVDAHQQESIEAVKNLILNEVNVKELKFVDNTAGILVKKIKPDFKKLGPRYGKIMKALAATIQSMSQEDINAFDKLKFEAQFQALSPGGAISYVEVPDMQNNLEAVLQVMKFIYENIIYAELNTKSDYCQVCGWDGEIQIVEENGKLIWKCPKCGNTDQDKMNVARRTCGYIGTQFWNQGRTQEIKERVLHL